MKWTMLVAGILACGGGGCHGQKLYAQEGEKLKDEPAGMLEAEVGGRRLRFPALKIDVKADVSGDLATVVVTQTFANPLDRPVHATYLFPLYEHAAVYAMTMDVGNERIKAQIKAKDEAVQVFQEAKAEGKSAALMTQRRPNMFTQDVANLMPGLPIKVEIKYVHAVAKEDGVYKLVVPLVVGPRYQPGEARQSEPLPDYPDVAGLSVPKQVDQDRVTLRVRIDGGMPANDVVSPTHAVVAGPGSGFAQIVALKAGKTIDNRDFELRYRLAGDGVKAGLLAHRDGRGGFFSLLLEPPREPKVQDITPREMVFILDCSGSMEGLPLEASKAFMRRALTELRPTDSFRIIRFSDGASEFASSPVQATPESVRRGIRYVNGLAGEGGTEMSAGIKLALDVPPPPGSLRLVTFLTDGYIGNEIQILSMVKEKLGGARLYAFGVGSAVNRYLLNKLGEVGRGFTRYMDPTESVDEVAAELAARLNAPVLTDISIDWGSLTVEGQAPAKIPDLFAGGSVRIQGRYENPGVHQIKVRGKVNGKEAVLPLSVNLPAAESDGEAIAIVWAREMIEDLMSTMLEPESVRQGLGSNEDVKAAVTTLGLEFGLVTQWTAFVAVSEEVYNDKPELAQQKNVPLPMVAGVTGAAYGEFAGSSTPEPAEWLGMVLILCFTLYAMRRMQFI